MKKICIFNFFFSSLFSRYHISFIGKKRRKRKILVKVRKRKDKFQKKKKEKGKGRKNSTQRKKKTKKKNSSLIKKEKRKKRKGKKLDSQVILLHITFGPKPSCGRSARGASGPRVQIGLAQHKSPSPSPHSWLNTKCNLG